MGPTTVVGPVSPIFAKDEVCKMWFEDTTEMIKPKVMKEEALDLPESERDLILAVHF